MTSENGDLVLAVPSTSTEVAKLKVTPKNKLTAKQKKRNRVEAQTPEKKRDTAAKTLLATQLRRSLSYNKPETNVIMESRC